MPTVQHDDVRDELLAGLSKAGRRQLEAFASIYEARQVAARITELRAVAQISQREAARRAGIDQADLSRIESAQITPSLPTLLRILDAVGGTLVLARKTPARPPADAAVETARVPASTKAAARRVPARQAPTTKTHAAKAAIGHARSAPRTNALPVKKTARKLTHT